jgi:hypothetical protein
MIPIPGHVVEIGSFKGRATAFLAEGCRRRGRGVVVTIDTFRGSPEHENDPDVRNGAVLERFKGNIDQQMLTNFVVPLVGQSHEIAAHWTAPIRLLFIDGAHDAQNVRRDFESWSPHLSLFGSVAFHDYDNSTHPEVRKFVDEVVMKKRDFRYIHTVDSMAVFERVA